MDVTRRVWPYMLSITLAYLVTLMLYPGVVTEVTSCRFGSWMPVILIIAFNVSDFVGKVKVMVHYSKVLNLIANF